MEPENGHRKEEEIPNLDSIIVRLHLKLWVDVIHQSIWVEESFPTKEGP